MDRDDDLSGKVRFGVSEGVATITLARPEAGSALDLETARDLARLAVRCDEDPGIRAVVLTGEGRFFCAGGDLKTFHEAGEGSGALIKEVTLHLHGAISRFARMDPPLLAAVNGMAAGAGFSLAVACDRAVAAASATFLSAYTAAGLSPDGSSTWFLPRRVGWHRALDLMLTNRRLSAEEAVAWGLVDEVVPDGEALPAALEQARRLAAGPTGAYGAVKRLLRASATNGLETQMELEARTIADLSLRHDGVEGIAAFVEKRRPDFRGR